MEMIETRQIAAEPALVWAALLNPDVLKVCVPGCEELTGDAESGFEAVVVQKVGPVKARFTGTVAVSDRIEGEALTLTGEGKGGAAGFARGEARITLTPEGEGTALSYKVDARVGGKLAQLGSRIVDGFARKMADDFFSRFQAALETPPATDADEQPEADPTAEASAQTPRKGWFRRMIGKDTS